MTAVADGIRNLLNQCLDQQADQAASGATVLLGAGGGSRSLPKQLAVTSVDQRGFCSDPGVAGQQLIASPVLGDGDVHGSVSAKNLVQLIQRQAVDILRVDHAVLAEGLIYHANRQHVVAGLG